MNRQITSIPDCPQSASTCAAAGDVICEEIHRWLRAIDRMQEKGASSEYSPTDRSKNPLPVLQKNCRLPLWNCEAPPTQFSRQPDQRQTSDCREVVTFNAVKQRNPGFFNLVTSRTVQRLIQKNITNGLSTIQWSHPQSCLIDESVLAFTADHADSC